MDADLLQRCCFFVFIQLSGALALNLQQQLSRLQSDINVSCIAADNARTGASSGLRSRWRTHVQHLTLFYTSILLLQTLKGPPAASAASQPPTAGSSAANNQISVLNPSPSSPTFQDMQAFLYYMNYQFVFEAAAQLPLPDAATLATWFGGISSTSAGPGSSAGPAAAIGTGGMTPAPSYSNPQVLKDALHFNAVVGCHGLALARPLPSIACHIPPKLTSSELRHEYSFAAQLLKWNHFSFLHRINFFLPFFLLFQSTCSQTDSYRSCRITPCSAQTL